MGTVFAHEPKAYRTWSGRKRVPKAPMSDAAIEAGIMRIAAQFPENVERVVA